MHELLWTLMQKSWIDACWCMQNACYEIFFFFFLIEKKKVVQLFFFLFLEMHAIVWIMWIHCKCCRAILLLLFFLELKIFGLTIFKWIRALTWMRSTVPIFNKIRILTNPKGNFKKCGPLLWMRFIVSIFDKIWIWKMRALTLNEVYCHAPNPIGSSAWEGYNPNTCKFFLNYYITVCQLRISKVHYQKFEYTNP